MNRERRELMKDKARRYAQGVLENLELIWRFENETEEEIKIIQREIDAIAQRIGKLRKYTDAP